MGLDFYGLFTFDVVLFPSGIYSSLYSLFKSFFKKVSIERLILAPVIFKIIGVSGLVYIGLVGPGAFIGRYLGKG